ncbi:MAG TPA: PhzF family phenazine biosynthesis protein [Longimicrobium sp.]
MAHRFVIADVFTDRAFGGNQLAVIPDARGISDRAMQTLAREFNFSETTFVLPPRASGHAYQLRIFTPATELAFAGHPTVGTAAVLARLGRIETQDGAASIVCELGVGPVSVDVRLDGERTFARLSLEATIEMPPTHPSPADAAAALSLPADAVREAWFATVGTAFAFVHVADREAVDAAVIDRAAWSRHFERAFSSAIFFFAGDLSAGSRLYARMVAPGFGVEEDAATGSAAATLAGCLADRLPERDGVFAWTINQGVKMGRPSLIEAAAEKRDGRAVRVMAGGGTVVVAEGNISLPEGF